MLAWRTCGHNNGLFAALKAINLSFGLGDPLLTLSKGKRRVRHPINLDHQPLNQRVRLIEGQQFVEMGITEVITAARSPWQNPYAERLIGSIRRECLDHAIILSEGHLRRMLSSYFDYHHDARTHLSLDKDCPRPRAVQLPSTGNKIIAFPQVGGLHHRYERQAA